MKKLFVIVSLLSFSALAHAQFDKSNSTEIGERLLENTRKSYLNVKHYEGSSANITYYESRDQKPPQMYVTTTQAQIDYTRNGLLKIDGGDTAGMKFSVWSDGETSKLTVDSAGKAETKAEKELELTLAGASGISHGVASTVPSILAGYSWSNPLLNKGKVTFKGTELIGKYNCYVVEKELSQLKTIQTFWIDPKTYLLRQLKQNTVQEPLTEKQLEGVSPAHRQEAQKVGSGYLSTTQIFSIEKVEFNAEKDSRRVFELPEGIDKIIATEQQGILYEAKP